MWTVNVAFGLKSVESALFVTESGRHLEFELKRTRHDHEPAKPGAKQPDFETVLSLLLATLVVPSTLKTS